MSELQPPRGTQDILPPLSERFAHHERVSGGVFERAGYRRIITPMFEDTSLFVRGVGEGTDIVHKEMYTFLDRSENSLTLRPEGTAPVMRAVVSNHLAEGGLPLKLWYAAAMFRYDRPQKGRYRQHHQLGIEAIGTEDPAIDAEVIALGSEMLEGAGVRDATLLLNSIGHPGDDCRGAYLPRLRAWLAEHREQLDADCNRRMDVNPLRVFDCKNERDQALLDSAPAIEQDLCEACRAHFDTVQTHLKDLGISYTVTPRLVRGLDYYTRTTFEFQTALLEAAQNTVCGGGRYDGLSEAIGGSRLPGIGFGSGVERVLLAQEAAGAAPPTTRLDCVVIPLEAELAGTALAISRSLRHEGIRAALASEARSLKAQMKHVDRLGARFAVIIGSNEVARDMVAVRDMESGEQIETGQIYLAEWFDLALKRRGIDVRKADGQEPF